jgi:ABC-2 type transport system ATP-binding protein
MAVIRAEHLTKRFGKRVLAVDDVTFAIEPGTITVVLGPNGAGKTTTLRMILDLVRPTSGTVRILGSRYRELRAPARRVGALLDASGFHPGRSGRNALRVVAAGAGIPYGRVDEVLALVELEASAQRRVKGYSTGMKQRLALAAALLGDPEVLILDEPANGLDPEGMRWLRTFLRDRAAEGRTVLVSSHVLAEVEQTVDDVLILSKGRLLAQGPISALTASAQPVVRVRTPKAQDLEAALNAGGAAVNRLGEALAVRGPSAAQVGDLAHARGIPVHELLTEQPSLEDLFLQIAGTRRDDPAQGATPGAQPSLPEGDTRPPASPSEGDT